MKKQKIVLIIIIILLIITTIIYLTFRKNDTKTLTVKDITNNAENEVETVDWSNYKTKEIELKESLTIAEEGIYILKGTIEDGLITINTKKNVKLILNNVNITNTKGPAIYIENANVVEIETQKGTTNSLTDGKTYEVTDEDIDGCIYSKDNLILSGEGTLKITSNYQDGIVSKDNLKITSSTYIINSKDDAIRGKDSVVIEDGTFNIKAGNDGIKSTNEEDSNKGYIIINNGIININSTNDAIQAQTQLIIKDGKFSIATTGNASTDSAKGLKAETLIKINGGSFEITTTDDGIHSNGDINIAAGKFKIKSEDDGIHADGMIEINNGTFEITAAEGIEATYVKINDGTINISATDDGINAGNKSSAYSVKIEINGGNITITMGQGDTDGVDSNGDIIINGGTISVTGQSTFDYDGTGTINGGTVICNGEKVTTLPNQMMGGSRQQGQPEQNQPPQDNMNERRRQR